MAPGPVAAEEVDRLTKPVLLPQPLDAIVLSGSLPAGAGPANYHAMAEEAHHAGIATVLDAEGETLLEGLRPGTLLIKPNRHEASLALGRAAQRPRQCRGRCHRIPRLRRPLCSDHGWWPAGRPRGSRRRADRGSDPVGAGVAFLGVLLLRLPAQTAPAEALRWAVAAGATAAAGTVIGQGDQAEALLEGIKIDGLPEPRPQRVIGVSRRSPMSPAVRCGIVADPHPWTWESHGCAGPQWGAICEAGERRTAL